MFIRGTRGPVVTFAIAFWFVPMQHAGGQFLPGRHLSTPICEAIVAGNVGKAVQLVEQGGDVNAGHGCALVAAASRAQPSLVKLLLDRGANPNRKATGDVTVVFGGSTPLVAGVQSRDPAVMRLLLQRGADPKEDYEAFSIVLEDGDAGLADLLLAHGADPNMRPPAPGQVYSYAGNRQVAVPARDLKPDRIDETAKRLQCRMSATAGLLHRAADAGAPQGQDGRVEIARRLIEKGADVNARALDGSTPLMMAASQHNHRIVTMLLTAGADLSATDRCGRTARDYADLHPRHLRAYLAPQTKALLGAR